jgi:hypothetical protein
MTTVTRSLDFLDPAESQRVLVEWGHLAPVEVDYEVDGRRRRLAGFLYCPMVDDTAVYLCDSGDTGELDDRPLDNLLDGLRQVPHALLRSVRLIGEPKGRAT